MASNKAYNLILGGVFLTLTVVLDQVTKIWAVAELIPGQSTEVLGRFFMFTLVYNRGGALGTNFGSTNYYLIASTVILLIVLYYAWLHGRDRHMVFPLAFIAGGAIGNIVDRFRLGQVIDFLDVEFFDVSIGTWQLDRWWTFNIADVAISCAIIYLLIYLLFFHKAPPVPEEPTDTPSIDTRQPST